MLYIAKLNYREGINKNGKQYHMITARVNHKSVILYYDEFDSAEEVKNAVIDMRVDLIDDIESYKEERDNK